MTRKTDKAHSKSSSGQPKVSPVPILPPGPGQQGYWMVPLPPAPGELPGQPIQWAPVVAYGQATYSQQASTALPPPPANPEWTALAGEDPIPVDDPTLSPPPSAAPDSATGNQGQAPEGFGQGMDWFVVPIPAPPGSEDNVPSDGPSALISPEDGGAPSAKVS